VDRLALGVLGHERGVTRVLHVAGDARDGVVPADVLPVIRAGLPHLGREQPVAVGDVALERGALRAERAAADRVIRIAFHVDDRSFYVLRLVAERVDDDAAGDRAIRTCAARLGRARNLELAHFRARRLEIEANRCGSRTGREYFQEGPTFHQTPPQGLKRSR